MSVSQIRTKKVFHLVQIIFAIIGMGVSLYLLIQHTRLSSGIQGGSSFCSLGSLVDCDIVNASQYSEIFGIPLAGLGTAFFFFLLLLGIMAPPKSPFFPRIQQIIAWLSLLGLGMDSVLFVIQIYPIQSICLLCLLTYLAGFVIFFCSVKMTDKPQQHWTKRTKTLLLPKQSSALPPSPTIILSLVALLSFCTALTLLPGYLKLHSNTYSMVNDAIAQFFDNWKNKKESTIDWKEGDGTFGDPNSRVQVVEFSDYECPHCHKAAFTLHAALKPLKNEIFFVFKNFPLDSSCNPLVSFQLHQNACLLARLAYCANQKNQFWKFHDLIFLKLAPEDITQGMDVLSDKLSGILTKDEIQKCLSDKKSLENVTKDIQVAKGLGIRGTPSIFINGKPVKIPLTVESLRKLVRLEASLTK